MLFFVAAAALVAVAAGLVAVVGLGSDEEKPRSAAPAVAMGVPVDTGVGPASYSSSPSTGVYAPLARRADDPAPLYEAEVFPKEAAALPDAQTGARLALRGKRLDHDCAEAIWGRALGEELRRGGCTQAARTLYADTRAGYALTTAVFNLASVEDADRAVEALGRGRGGGFVKPLSGAAPLDRFGTGFSMARGLALGHYVVVSWAQRLDGKGTETDEGLLSLLIEGGKSPAVLGRAARAGQAG
ncbi:hypothetical protein DPM19_06310 [Actinomadura craniellae]|uniref:Uncharacterized protein n=1 Tax=Actinomadura craniellae TaxID=2231787 RepID=A0A365HBL4_9ACTN|nr:hypothetical protein [Actinomadura craniellae]RAY16475.1 hypothetical protein DPM19_06310 [Actinomadura craniellae]